MSQSSFPLCFTLCFLFSVPPCLCLPLLSGYGSMLHIYPLLPEESFHVRLVFSVPPFILFPALINVWLSSPVPDYPFLPDEYSGCVPSSSLFQFTKMPFFCLVFPFMFPQSISDYHKILSVSNIWSVSIPEHTDTWLMSSTSQSVLLNNKSFSGWFALIPILKMHAAVISSSVTSKTLQIIRKNQGKQKAQVCQSNNI